MSKIGKLCSKCHYWVPNKSHPLSRKYFGDVCLEHVVKGHSFLPSKPNSCTQFQEVSVDPRIAQTISQTSLQRHKITS
ncbi:MAG: hypothetical protein HQL70_07745 [Magnetococcales bacterium]|nr:hypothetical protein [Magnetococcales bacterium]